jgi:hypothetical protein
LTAIMTRTAFAWADALVASRRLQGRNWRYDLGYSAFPPPKVIEEGRIDAPVAKRQPESR